MCLKTPAPQTPTIFQIFGSASSTDLDAVFFVENIPNIKQAADICKAYAEELAKIISTNKKINTNIAVIGYGIVQDVHKGTVDELNNALYLTYDLHQQWHPLKITRLVPRDIPLKMQRCARKILTFLTRTHLRKEVKNALRGEMEEKITLLEKIKFADFADFGKKGSPIEFRKAMAFQLGQTLGLCIGIELYTKEAIAEHFPALGPSLRREAAKNEDLQKFLEKFIQHYHRLKGKQTKP